MAVGRIDSNELLQLRLLALDAAANAVVITDRDGLIVWVNQAFTRSTGFAADGTIRYESPAVLRILGYEPHELEGHSAFEFMPEEDAAKAIALLQNLLATPGATGTLAFRFRHKDGSWRVLEAIGKNMLDHPML